MQLSEQEIIRREKLQALRDLGINPYPGDLIYTGTPAGVGPTAKGDVFEGFFEGQSVFSLKVNP